MVQHVITLYRPRNGFYIHEQGLPKIRTKEDFLTTAVKHSFQNVTISTANFTSRHMQANQGLGDVSQVRDREPRDSSTQHINYCHAQL